MTEPLEPPEPTPAPSALVFPTDFPIKIMGLNHLDFEPQVVELVRLHAPDLDLNTIEVRQSSAGKYLALTVTIRAQSRVQLDAIYLALTSHPLVKVVL
jgi:putative lipoic acid-binding regulatory protein